MSGARFGLVVRAPESFLREQTPVRQATAAIGSEGRADAQIDWAGRGQLGGFDVHVTEPGAEEPLSLEQ